MSAKHCIICKTSNHCVQASDNSLKHIHIFKHNFNVSQGMFLRHTAHQQYSSKYYSFQMKANIN